MSTTITLPGPTVAALRAGTLGEAAAYLESIGQAEAAAELRARSRYYARDADRGMAAFTDPLIVEL